MASINLAVMFGGGMHPGQHYDRFVYAAMLSKARIEQAWSGSAEDPEATSQAELPKEAEPQAFDPEMLKKLAQKAENGEIPEAPVMPLANTKGFSSAVIQAASSMMKMPMVAPRDPPSFSAPSSNTSASEGASNSVPLAFRPKVAKPVQVSEASPSAVPLAFRKMKQASAPSVTYLETPSSDGAQPYDPTAQPSTDGQGQGHSAQAAGMGDQFALAPQSQVGTKPGDGEQDDSRKKEVNAAVQNIVSLKLEQAQKAVESTKAFHAVAPEPKPADQNRETRRRSRWNDDAEKGSAPMRVDTSDPAFQDKAYRPSGGGAAGDSIAESYSVPSLRELSTLARGEPSSDAPALGELRAPSDTAQWTDDKKDFKAKTGAQLARDQKAHATRPSTRRSRSRSRDRRRRRSPSSSPERAGKRLFTNKPSFRLTGSSFSSASSKPADAKPADSQMTNLKKEDVPDWLKDMVEPAPQPAPPMMGKKYLHMPRLMIEVLTHNGGEAIRACIEKSGAQIRVETMIEEPIGIVSVNGQHTIAEKCIREILANKGLDLPPQDGLVLPYVPVQPTASPENMQDIQIPSELVRHFVGHRGCNLKAITQKMGHAVSIQILPSILPGGFQRIQITGSNRQEARRLVIQHIDELKRQKLTLWGDNHKSHNQTPVPPPPPPATDGIRI